MEWTDGTMLFYGGLCGLGLTLAATLAVAVVLGMGGARLRARLDEEYGKRKK